MNNLFKGIASTGIVNENIMAMKNEILRKAGVGVCHVINSRIMSFLPTNWRLKLFLATPTGKHIMTILLAQAVGNTMYIFKDKLSSENQRILDLLRQSAWAASASAMIELSSVDKLFDMLVPDEAKNLLVNSAMEIQQLESKLTD